MAKAAVNGKSSGDNSWSLSSPRRWDDIAQSERANDDIRRTGSSSVSGSSTTAASRGRSRRKRRGDGRSSRHSSEGDSTAGVPTVRTRGPYYGNLEAPGEFERMLRTVSHGGELALLHGNGARLRLLVNLIATLNAQGIYHILLLGFDEATCKSLMPRGRIGCAHSSYLWDTSAPGEAGELAVRREMWTLAPRYVAWIQKFHYMRRLIESHINVLALDSDVVATADPYPYLRGRFGKYSMVTAFDTKGGFANINVGIVYTNNASATGPVHGLFAEFERRVAMALRFQPASSVRQREHLAVRYFWDQNLFNKVLLSRLIDRDVYMPDDSDTAWTASHRSDLMHVARPGPIEHGPGGLLWKTGMRRPVRAPRKLTVRAPWYPRDAEYKWAELPTPYTALRSEGGAYGAARAGSPGSGASPPPERILLAPPWLISADNALGHRYKHWLYGAKPAPCVLLHFVCVASGEKSRILPMQLFGRWHARAVDIEVAAAEAVARAANSTPAYFPGGPRPTKPDPVAVATAAAKATAAAYPSEQQPTDDGAAGGGGSAASRASSRPRRKLLAIAGSTIESPLTPRPWPELNALQGLVGALAMMSGRTFVLPALNCTRVVESGDAFMRPGMLPNRCFWHVHAANGGVACVFRVGGCAENLDLASPVDLQAALKKAEGSGAVPPPPTLTLDVPLFLNWRLHMGPGPTMPFFTRLLTTHAEAEVIFVDITKLPAAPGPGGTVSFSAMRDSAQALHARLPGFVRAFQRECTELTDRSKRKKRECTNVC